MSWILVLTWMVFMQLRSVTRQTDNTHWAAAPERVGRDAMVFFVILFGNTHWAASPERVGRDAMVMFLRFGMIFLATPIGRRYQQHWAVYAMVIFFKVYTIMLSPKEAEMPKLTDRP